MSGFTVDDKSQVRASVLQELREVQDVVEAKATPDEATAFARWMIEVAQDAANAAKEGGFMGFGAEQVSEGEQRMLDQLRTTLGAAEG